MDRHIHIFADSVYYIDIHYFNCKTNLFGKASEVGEWNHSPGDFADFITMRYNGESFTFFVKASNDSIILTDNNMQGLFFVKI